MKIFENNESLAVFSDKNDGDLNFYNFDSKINKEKWKNLTDKLSIKSELPLFVNQVHKSEIFQVNNDTQFPISSICADALITDLPNKAIGVFTADCCPVLISNKKAISATHAGWKSTLLNISGKTVHKFYELYGINPSELTAYIGPCIGSCCFELGDEVYDMFISSNKEWNKFFIRSNKWHLDLRGLNYYQLNKAGIPSDQIIDFNECTYCYTEKYYSYRRMKKRNGSMFSFIYLK